MFLRNRPETLLLALLALLVSFPANAASGGPDAHGLSWFDRTEGCSREHAPFGPEALVEEAPAGLLGPFELGFLAGFQGEVVSRVWISPHGWLAFVDPAADDPLPRVLPDASAPRLLLAPSWDGEPARLVQVEAQDGRFRVDWTWTIDGFPLREFITHLTIERSGDIRLSWDSFGVGVLGPDVVFGYQDLDASDGVTFLQGDTAFEPGFVPQLELSSTCLVGPVLLDCSDAALGTCGESLALTLGPADLEHVTTWTCSESGLPASEAVFEVELGNDAALRLTATSALPDELTLFELRDGSCSERDCVTAGRGELAVPLLRAGRHRFVLDGTFAQLVQVSIACSAPAAIDCGAAVEGTTEGQLSRRDEWPCVPVPLPGPETTLVLDHAASGHLSVDLEAGAPGSWLILTNAAGDCLGAEQGSVSLFDAEVGRYFVTVDSPEGPGAPFRVSTTCGTRFDASHATPAACSATLSGDTTGAPDVAAHYSCLEEALPAGAAVFALDLEEETFVTARLLDSVPGQRVLLLAGDDEGSCRSAGPVGACASLPPGRSFVVVDGTAGAEGAFTLELACGSARAAAGGLSLTGLDASELGPPCRSLDLDGLLRVELVAGAAPPSGALELLAYEDRDGVEGFGSTGDVLLGQLAIDAPAALTRSLVEVPVSGSLPYRGAVLGVALHDAAGAELDSLDQRVDCEDPPPAVSLEPAHRAWTWRGSDVERTFDQVISTPLVADLDGDGTEEVVIVTQEDQCGATTKAIVRALDGRSGAELWAATAEEAAAFCEAQPAAADLDGDGRLEIVVPSSFDRNRLVCLDADGHVVWLSEPYTQFTARQSAPAIGDVDGDGVPEISVGRDLFRADGSLAWIPEDAPGFDTCGGGPMSVLADLDGDGRQDVISGPVALTLGDDGIGHVLWASEQLELGVVAVGQLDSDAPPEVVLSANGRVSLLDGEDGRLRWSTELPQSGRCGSPFHSNGYPALADLEGDGRAEILVATSDSVVALDADGGVLWLAPVQDCSSGITGVTAFDLDGDGEMEVIHADEIALRVLRGSDGTQLFALPHGSGTALEMPVVADPDGDGRAEILVAENTLLFGGTGLAHGLDVWEGPDPGWAGARAIWNQVAYHGGNVLDDGRVPVPGPFACLPPSPTAATGFRVQEPRPLSGVPLPNLTLAVTALEVERLTGCKYAVRIRARVGNAGGAPAAASEVVFFDGDPAAGGTPLDTRPLPALAPGEWADVETLIDHELTAAAGLFAVADAAAVVAECREDDNDCRVDGDELRLLLEGRPEPVGPALRLRDHGPSALPEITATLDWSLDAHAPRTGGDHYHLLRGTDPRLLRPVAELEPWTDVSVDESTPRRTGERQVHFYRVIAANACELEEIRIE